MQVDRWLGELFAEAAGPSPDAALVAVGGYGRGELAPGSDVDVLLLHRGRRDIAQVAQRLWYPVWDAKVKLGHAVRTVKEALRLADGDLETATALLTVRHLAGDPALSRDLAAAAERQWQKRAKRWLTELAAATAERHQRAGEVAHLLEPDLKDGRGGMRDVHGLRWAERARLVLLPFDHHAVDRSYELLLSVRVELQRRTRRPGNVLLLEEQDAVADALGYASADALMAKVAGAARTVAWTADEVWHAVSSSVRGPSGRNHQRDRPLAPGVFLRDGEVHVDATAHPPEAPALGLRAAPAAAHHRTRIDRDSLDRLARETPPFPDPWPPTARGELVGLLLEGHAAVPVIEALDQRGLMARVLPEWGPVRSKPQRNALHRYTVDRHLLEAAANAAELAPRVSRPDLLVLAALLHDLGKGYRGDHTERGVGLVGLIGPRLGLVADDVEVLTALVRLHLLLPDVATRRDLSDDATISAVAEAVGSPLVLELLHALTEADGRATGRSAWSSWKAELVDDLVGRTAHVLGGGEVHEVAWSLFPSPEVQADMAAMRTRVRVEGDTLTVVAPDRPGLFSAVAGVLALHGVDVLGAQAHSDDHGMAASEFRVAPAEQRDLPWDRVLADLDRALAGRLALEARLAVRTRDYGRRPRLPVAPTVLVDNDASSTATVIEVRAHDGIGVLYRITRALAEVQLDIRHAKVATLGHEVVDSFYVRDSLGQKVTDPQHLRELELAVLHELSVGAAAVAR